MVGQFVTGQFGTGQFGTKIVTTGNFKKAAHFRSNIREVFTVLHQRCAKTIHIVDVRYEFELNIFACCHEMTQDSLIIRIKDSRPASTFHRI